MTLLFKNAQIIDPEAGTVTQGDVMVRDGTIV
jgi:dihydroorotase-like cyclic amidohydrolase